MANPVTNQQALPKLDSPVVRENFNAEIPWYRLFTYFWNCLGNGRVMPSESVYFQQNATPGKLDVYDGPSGVRIGGITLGP